MILEEVMSDLKANGNESVKKTLVKHGAKEPFFGVKAEYLKKLQKKIKKDHDLALKLYSTGNSDAMYFAGMICDPQKMTRDDLNRWVEKAYWYYLSEHTVNLVAAHAPNGTEIALEWIKSDKENVAAAGWATLSAIISRNSEVRIDTKVIKTLLNSIPEKIHKSQNRVRYCMNNFVIATGAFIPEMKDLSKEVAQKNGVVKVDMGGTACKVPDAISYIKKIEARNNNKSVKK